MTKPGPSDADVRQDLETCTRWLEDKCTEVQGLRAVLTSVVSAVINSSGRATWNEDRALILLAAQQAARLLQAEDFLRHARQQADERVHPGNRQELGAWCAALDVRLSQLEAWRKECDANGEVAQFIAPSEHGKRETGAVIVSAMWQHRAKLSEWALKRVAKLADEWDKAELSERAGYYAERIRERAGYYAERIREELTANPPTYTLSDDNVSPAWILCNLCDLHSYHAKDISERYCANCHLWHEQKDPDHAG